MPRKRPNEPIGPTTVPGQATDPKIPPDQRPESDEDLEREESEEERQARESEKAFDQSTTRMP